MDGLLERARLLLAQQRPLDAEKFAKKSLEEEGESSEAFLIITEALIQTGKPKDAIEAAKETLRLEPDDYLSHFMLGWAYMADGQYKKAEKHILTAREIYPDDADAWGFLALLEIQKKHWEKALKLAEHGLSLDSENTNCVNARARALVNLKRGSEATDTIDSALSRDPENAQLHYNKGYTLLQKGDFDAAIQAFGEALRLEPNFDAAKEALVEALKGRYKIYALFLKYVFFMSRLTSGQQFGIFIGGYIAQRFGNATLTNAGYPLFGGLVTGIYLILIIFTWGASSIFNALLFLHPIGRYALDKKEKRISLAVNINLLVAIILAITGIALGSLAIAVPAIGFMVCIIPYASLSSFYTPWKLWVVALFSAGVNLVSLSAVYLAFIGQHDQAFNLSIGAFIACMIYSWLPGFMADG